MRPARATWIQYGRSSQMMTLGLAYTTIQDFPGTIKLQLNLIDPLHHAPVELEAGSLLQGRVPPELDLLDPDLTARYTRPTQCLAYDAREILAEKGRAILLECDLGRRAEDHLAGIRRKVAFSLESARRYGEQMDLPNQRFAALLEDDIRPLVLKPVESEAFKAYCVRLLRFLEEEAARLAVD